MPLKSPSRARRRPRACTGLFPVARSSPSKTSAAVQVPIGTSVITGCKGASNQTPSSMLRAFVPPASTAFCTSGCTASETSSRNGNASTMRCMSVCAISSAFPLGGTWPLYPNSGNAIRARYPLPVPSWLRPALSSRPGGLASARSGCTGIASSPGRPRPCPSRSRCRGHCAGIDCNASSKKAGATMPRANSSRTPGPSNTR